MLYVRLFYVVHVFIPVKITFFIVNSYTRYPPMNAVKLAKSTVPENYASAKVASILLNYDAISFKKIRPLPNIHV